MEIHVRQRVTRFRGNGFYARKPGTAETLCGADPTIYDLSLRDALHLNDWPLPAGRTVCPACRNAIPTV